MMLQAFSKALNSLSYILLFAVPDLALLTLLLQTLRKGRCCSAGDCAEKLEV